MKTRELAAWLILGEAKHGWQLMLVGILNATCAVIAACHGNVWWAVFLAFCAGLGVERSARRQP